MKICALGALGQRDDNQDCALAGEEILQQSNFAFKYLSKSDDSIQMFAVADGIGGESGGALASYKALEILKKEMKDDLQTSKDIEYCADKAEEILEQISKELSDMLREKNCFGGTTISILLLYSGRYVTINIGDSPIVLYKKRKSIELFNRHTLAQMKIDSGIDKKDLDERSYHCLLQSLGSVGFYEAGRFSGTYEKGDIFSIMSDGVEFLNRRSAKRILNKIFLTHYRKKMSRAKDNATLIVVKV